MKTEINPQDTSRLDAFRLWMSSPMPMVTLVKTLDVTRVRKCCNKHKCSFNMLLCWCIGRAASTIPEFLILPEKGKLFQYDHLAINIIVNNAKGGVNSCDVPFLDDWQQFNQVYQQLTKQVAAECKSCFCEDMMVIGTSAMIATELDCVINQYTEKFCNPIALWGKYHKGWFKTTLPISFQFHHVQMDGGHAACFLERLQSVINQL